MEWPEHHACMVDLLGRSGLLVEAIQFINSMPLCYEFLKLMSSRSGFAMTRDGYFVKKLSRRVLHA